MILIHMSHVIGSSLYSELNAPRTRSRDVKLCSSRPGQDTGTPVVAFVIVVCMFCGNISGRDCLKSDTRYVRVPAMNARQTDGRVLWGGGTREEEQLFDVHAKDMSDCCAVSNGHNGRRHQLKHTE